MTCVSFRSRLGQHQPGCSDVHRMFRSSPEVGVSHLSSPIPRPRRVAPRSPGRHGLARERSCKFDLGIGPPKSAELPETGTEFISGGERAVHHGQVQSERVPGAAHFRDVDFSKPGGCHLQVKHF